MPLAKQGRGFSRAGQPHLAMSGLGASVAWPMMEVTQMERVIRERRDLMMVMMSYCV